MHCVGSITNPIEGVTEERVLPRNQIFVTVSRYLRAEAAHLVCAELLGKLACKNLLSVDWLEHFQKLVVRVLSASITLKKSYC